MNVMDAIRRRRSIRTFTGEAISDEELKTILIAAQASPVGLGAYDNLRITVIKDKDVLDMINKNAQAVFKRNDAMLYNAPMLILVSTKLTGTAMDNIAYSNAATIIENMVLAAVEMEIGACHIWGPAIAIAGNAELVKKLVILEGFAPIGSVALGKTAEQYKPRKIRNRIPVREIG